MIARVSACSWLPLCYSAAAEPPIRPKARMPFLLESDLLREDASVDMLCSGHSARLVHFQNALKYCNAFGKVDADAMPSC